MVQERVRSPRKANGAVPTAEIAVNLHDKTGKLERKVLALSIFQKSEGRIPLCWLGWPE